VTFTFRPERRLAAGREKRTSEREAVPTAVLQARIYAAGREAVRAFRDSLSHSAAPVRVVEEPDDDHDPQEDIKPWN
jgi:hypothetical protein